jgi:cell division initiation protein
LKAELEKLQASYTSLKEVEVMINKTLHQAEQSTKDTLDNARRRATLIVNEAEAKAREVVRNGVEQRQNIDREIAELCSRRDEILHQLQSFLKTQTDRLAGFGQKESPTLNLNGEASTSKDKKTDASVFTQEKIPANGEKNHNSLDDIVEQL